MKKVMCIIVALIFAVSVCACGESKNKGNKAAFDDTGDEFLTLATIPAILKAAAANPGPTLKNSAAAVMIPAVTAAMIILRPLSFTKTRISLRNRCLRVKTRISLPTQ